MKPKPNHYMRLRVFHDDEIVCQYTARTAEELSKSAGISKARIYTHYRRGTRGNLKMCGLTYEITEENSADEVEKIECNKKKMMGKTATEKWLNETEAAHVKTQ